MLSCSGRGEGGAGGSWTVGGGLIAVGACGWWAVNDGANGGRTAGVGVGRVRCSSFATGSGWKASRLSGAARVMAGVNFRRNSRLRNVMPPDRQRGSRTDHAVELRPLFSFCPTYVGCCQSDSECGRSLPQSVAVSTSYVLSIVRRPSCGECVAPLRARFSVSRHVVWGM